MLHKSLLKMMMMVNSKLFKDITLENPNFCSIYFYLIVQYIIGNIISSQKMYTFDKKK